MEYNKILNTVVMEAAPLSKRVDVCHTKSQFLKEKLTMQLVCNVLFCS